MQGRGSEALRSLRSYLKEISPKIGDDLYEKSLALLQKDRASAGRAHPSIYQWQYNLQESVDGDGVDIEAIVRQLPRCLESAGKSRLRAKENAARIGCALDVSWEDAKGSRSEARAAQILKDLGSERPEFVFNSVKDDVAT